MKHSMTIEALGSNCYSSLAIPACDISNDRHDDREALVFFEHDEVEMMPADPAAWSVIGYRRHIIGVALGDLVMTRDEAFETLRNLPPDQLMDMLGRQP